MESWDKNVFYQTVFEEDKGKFVSTPFEVSGERAWNLPGTTLIFGRSRLRSFLRIEDTVNIGPYVEFLIESSCWYPDIHDKLARSGCNPMFWETYERPQPLKIAVFSTGALACMFWLRIENHPGLLGKAQNPLSPSAANFGFPRPESLTIPFILPFKERRSRITVNALCYKTRNSLLLLVSLPADNTPISVPTNLTKKKHS